METLDGVKLITGEEVSAPVVKPVLDALNRILSINTEDSVIALTALMIMCDPEPEPELSCMVVPPQIMKVLQKEELVCSDGKTIYESIKRVVRASLFPVMNDEESYYIIVRNPLPFPIEEL